MKVAITMAVIGVIIGEFIASQSGLGCYILNAGSRLNTADVFAALVVLCAVGVALYGLVALAERGVRRVYGRR
jgi:NitT/TauT family transport system permease protein